MHIYNGKYPYTDWATDFPNVAFALPNEGISYPRFGIFWVHDSPQPEHDPATEMVIEGDPVEVEGEWRKTWQVVPAPVPESVTMRQARLALLGAGLLSQVDTAINALPEPDRTAAQIEWEYSQEVQRDKAFVAMLAPALGLTEAQLDDLFRVASTL